MLNQICHIGLIGVTGSGKSIVLEGLSDQGNSALSLSSYVRKETEKLNLDLTRDNFAKVAKTMRSTNGNDIFAKIAYNDKLVQSKKIYLIDGIRHPEEINYFRKKINLTLIGIEVDSVDKLINRIMSRNRDSDSHTKEGIYAAINREYDSNELSVKKCLDMCEIKLNNSGDLDSFRNSVKTLKDLLFK